MSDSENFAWACRSVREAVMDAADNYGAENAACAACAAITALLVSRKPDERSDHFYKRCIEYTDKLVDLVNELIGAENPGLVAPRWSEAT